MPRPMPSFMKPKIRCEQCGRSLESQVGFTYIPYMKWECSYCGKTNYIIPYERRKAIKEAEAASDPTTDRVADATREAKKLGAVAGDLGKKGLLGVGKAIKDGWKKLKLKQKAFVVIIVIVAFAFLRIALQSQFNIPVKYSYTELLGRSYPEAEKMLNEAGFTNITTRELCCLGASEEDKEKNNKVAMVSFNGDSTFSSEDHFSSKSEVVLLYYSQVKIKVPLSSVDLMIQSSDTVFDILQKAGFRVIQTRKVLDLSHQNSALNMESISIGGNSDFKEGQEFDWDTEIIISHYPVYRQLPLSSEECRSLSLNEVIKKFAAAGFRDIRTEEHETEDYSYGERNVFSVAIGSAETFEAGAEYDRDTIVLIRHYPTISE